VDAILTFELHSVGELDAEYGLAAAFLHCRSRCEARNLAYLFQMRMKLWWSSHRAENRYFQQ
jgi:hypothetical protein